MTNSQPENSKRTKSSLSPQQAAEEKLRVYPDLTYHYGLSPREIGEMPPNIKQVYIDALPRLIAGVQARAIQAAAFPNLKKADQRRIQRDLKKALDRGKQAVQHQPRQLERAVHGVGIGLKKVGKKKTDVG